jgi:sulfite reductase beta subunit-like hemoprotein
VRTGTSRQGFRLYVGGLGPSPQVAQLLEELTPAEDLLFTVAAIIRVSTGWGIATTISRAAQVRDPEFGMDKFRHLVFKERNGLRSVLAGKILPILAVPEPDRPSRAGVRQAGSPNGIPNILAGGSRTSSLQKQAGYFMVSVRLTLGDVTGQKLRVLAFLARQFADGWVRTTNQQNLLLRWSWRQPLAVYRLLRGRAWLMRRRIAWRISRRVPEPIPAS